MGRPCRWSSQGRPTLRTHPTRRPREDIFSAGAELVISFCNFPAFSAAGSGGRRNGGAVLAPAELATIDPHPVQNDGQASGNRDDRSTHPAPLGHPHAPGLQPRPFTAVGKQYLRGLVEHRAQQGVATFGHPAIIVDLRRTGSASASGRHARRPPGNGGSVAAGRPSHGRSALPPHPVPRHDAHLSTLLKDQGLLIWI